MGCQESGYWKKLPVCAHWVGAQSTLGKRLALSQRDERGLRSTLTQRLRKAGDSTVCFTDPVPLCSLYTSQNTLGSVILGGSLLCPEGPSSSPPCHTQGHQRPEGPCSWSISHMSWRPLLPPPTGCCSRLSAATPQRGSIGICLGQAHLLHAAAYTPWPLLRAWARDSDKCRALFGTRSPALAQRPPP